jgi:hypothetical protein
MPPQNYVKELEKVQAIQYVGTNKDEVIEFGGGEIAEVDGKLQFMMYETMPMEIFENQWVTRNVTGVLGTFSEDFLTYFKPGGGGA